MKTRSRDVRSTRREVQAMKRGALDELTEDAEELGLYEDTPFTLPSGTQVDPREPWELPTQTKEN